MFLLQFLEDSQTVLYFLAAVLPSIVLFIYVYRKDKIEKEPMDLILKLLLLGGLLSTIVSIILEIIAEYAQTYYFTNHYYSMTVVGIVAAFFVGLIEEGSKFFFMKKFTWKNPNFNYTFDGVVYAVAVSLGFAAIENILYVFFYAGIESALSRAILTIPAHMSFAVFMGVFYGQAKAYDHRNMKFEKNVMLVLAYIIPVLLHTTYDGCLMVDIESAIIFFFIFVIILDILVIYALRRASRSDRYISRHNDIV